MHKSILYYTTFFNNQNTTIPVTILFPKDFVFSETAKTIKEAILIQCTLYTVCLLYLLGRKFSISRLN
jgi:hypothetical protein